MLRLGKDMTLSRNKDILVWRIGSIEGELKFNEKRNM